MNLARLQEKFAKNIYDQDNLEICANVNSSKIDINDRLDIYRGNVLGSFEDALSMTYPITHKIVGDDCFENFISKYNHSYRSNSGNLEDYGDKFPKLIKDLEKDHKLLYLSDVAKLEWFYNLAYFCKDAQVIDIKKLQSLSEEDFMTLSFELHPTCHIIASKYKIYSIWDENRQENINKEINLEENKGQFIMIERSSFKVNVHELTKIEYLFLELTKEGKNIYQIHEVLGNEKEGFDIGFLINKFISSSIITNFKIKNV
jgi:hypothetical protein